MRHPSLLILTAATLMGVSAAQAGELYTQIGVPGVALGYAQPLGPVFGVRADYTTLGNPSDQRTESGINYSAKLKLDRLALLADWFPFAGGFRITGGITSNKYQLDLLANGAGGSITIGNTSYATTAADQLKVQVRFPSSTPYLGLGWGHHAGNGLRFSMDLGANIGKATVDYSLSGPLAGRVSQADLDAEVAELRKGVGKVKFVPQVTLGLGYSF